MNKLEQTQKELLKAVTKSNILESELNQIKLMLEGRNTQYKELNKALKAIKTEIKFAFEDLEKHKFDDLFGDLMQISEITNNVYIED